MKVLGLASMLASMLASILVLTHSAYATESEAQKLSLQTPEQCSRSGDYDIYLSGIHTGTMSRTETWSGKSAVVTSNSQASILGIGTQYQQKAELVWSNESREWITEKFHQKVTGFRARDMQASFSDNGRVSKVEVDGDVERYSSDDTALRDVDTLAIQIREYLLQGRQQFRLIRQASDAIEPYQFYVQKPLTKKISHFGELSLIPVKQTGSEEVTYYFAPELDYQLIQARYHGIILHGLIELNRYSSTCKEG